MHECPECGQACDCDGEDTWVSWPYNMDCTHECEFEEEDDLRPDDEDEAEEVCSCAEFVPSVFEPKRCAVCRKVRPVAE